MNNENVIIVNLRPPEIVGAWERGDIDAAYVWEPALGNIEKTGKVITTSKKVAEQGSPTYDVWVVRKDFAKNNEKFLTQFIEVSNKLTLEYQNNPKAFIQDNDNLKKIANLTGSNIDDIKVVLPANTYLNLDEQLELLQGKFLDDIKKMAFEYIIKAINK
ncbi:hypothetical protein GKC56_04655 [Neisseriaceae bacterium PsAf]|nr:hypothetical protein [Neisseriaceae bacterium PsAf]